MAMAAALIALEAMDPVTMAVATAAMIAITALEAMDAVTMAVATAATAVMHAGSRTISCGCIACPSATASRYGFATRFCARLLR
jgi:hypothetical protein